MSLIGKTIKNNYKIKSKIADGNISTAWLADDLENSREVVVKTLKSEVISDRMYNIIRFWNEAVAVSKLGNPGIIAVYDVGVISKNVHYIVTEALQGSTLQDLFDRGKKFNINETVFIIYRVCEAMSHAHENNFLHTNLKPGNIFLEYTEGSDGSIQMKSVKIIDFGLSHVKDFGAGRNQTDKNFISPEHTGKLGRKIDERSDLFSVGAVFYQMITNNPPPLDGGERALAEFPGVGADVPEIIMNIILKLMEREPEKRYRSFESLRRDLARYRKGETEFALGIDDSDIKLTFRAALVGRDTELNKLKHCYKEAMAGKGSICLIAGEDGRGKTRLANEIREIVLESNSTFIDGICTSGTNKAPYGPFKEALDRFIYHYQSYPEEAKKETSVNLRRKLSTMGNIIIQLNPVMKDMLGVFPPLSKLEGDREFYRFNTVAGRFFVDMAENEKGLVILLDDLQWADDGSIEILNSIAKNIGDSHLMVIGTYRDNEIDDDHPLAGFIKSAADNKYSVEQVDLKPLSQRAMEDFVSDILLDNSNVIIEVADFVMQKSMGNPRFAIELLRQLIDEKIIEWVKGRWILYRKKFDEVKISSDIVDALIHKSARLNDSEKEVLSYASVIGKEVDSEILYEAGNLSQDVIFKAMEKAIRLQIMERGLYDRNQVSFVHDRVRDYFYDLMDEQQKKEIHLKIAEMLEKTYKKNPEKVIYSLAGHYLASGSRLKGAEYAYRAGQKARDNYAGEDALTFFKAVLNIIEDKSYKGDLNWHDCISNIGDILLNMGRNDEALSYMEKLLPRVEDELQKAEIYQKMSKAYYHKGDFDSSVKYGKEGLGILGIKMPGNKSGVILANIKEFLAHFIYAHRARDKSKDKKQDQHIEKYKQIASIFVVLNWVYLLTDNLSFIHVILKGINFTARFLGISGELATFWSGYGGALMTLPMFKLSEKYLNKSLNMHETLENDWGIAQTYQVMGYHHELKGEYEQSLKYFNDSMDKFSKLGDIKELNMALNGAIHGHYFLADYQNMKKANDSYNDYARKSNDNYALGATNVYYIQYYRETGDDDKSEEYGRDAIKDLEAAENWFDLCVANTELGTTLMESGRAKEALPFLEKGRELYEANDFLKQYTVYVYYKLARGYILDYISNKDKLGGGEGKNYLHKIGKLSQTALKKTEKWATHYGGALRTHARYLSLAGQTKKADSYYQQSIAHCAGLNRKFEHALSLYEYGEFLAETGRKEEATRQYETAYYIFQETGAKNHEKMLAGILKI